MSTQPPGTAEELLLPNLPALDADDIERPADALLLAAARRAASTFTGKGGCTVAEHLAVCMEALRNEAQSAGRDMPTETSAAASMPRTHSSRMPHEVFINNVPRGVTQIELRPLMEQFGSVLKVNTRRARGFVTFASRAALDACLRAANGIPGLVVAGVKLQVRDNSEMAHRRLSESEQPPRRNDRREQVQESGARVKRRAPEVPPSDYVCHLCEVPGHYIKDCPFVSTNEESRDRSTRARSGRNSKDAGPTAAGTTRSSSDGVSSRGLGGGDAPNSGEQMTNRQRKRTRYQEILSKHKREEVQQQADDAALRKLQSETPCRFWALGRCKAGLDCPFLHAAGAQKHLDVVCEHFLSARGCDRGDACVFQHPKGGPHAAMRSVSRFEDAAAASNGAFSGPTPALQRLDPRPRESVVQVIRVRHARQPVHRGHLAQSNTSNVDGRVSAASIPLIEAAPATSAMGTARTFPNAAAAVSTGVGPAARHETTTVQDVQQTASFQETSSKPPTHELEGVSNAGGAVPLPPAKIARNEDLEDDSASEGADFGSVFDDFED
eukprot:INCI19689.1.p1 GENE.INCI19689.1~~INCI19689.1.p1  ORF type:complete len:553 (-),score=91.11 INCI19689.1:204-1862(-)